MKDMVLGVESESVYQSSNATESASTHPHTDVRPSSNDLHDLSPHVFSILQNFIAAQCDTMSLQPFYYHIGCAFFLLAFLAPSYRYGTALYMRCMLTFGCILFLMWSYLVECRPDVLLWTLLFIFVNILHMALLICKLRPVKFEKEIEEVYVSLFQPLRVSRRRFKKILKCLKTVRKFKSQEIYVQEKISKVDSLSLVLSGKFVVSQNQKALHIVFPNQFLDSPEYFGVSTDDYFNVSITCIEDARVLQWHRDKLKLSIDEYLKTMFDHILAKDVVKKLMQVSQVSETMQQSNGYVATNCAYDEEDKPMLLMKKSIDNQGNGLTALINKQLQADNNFEHVPLLVTPSQYNNKQNASSLKKNNVKVGNGNGLIDIIEHQQQHIQQQSRAPVLMSSNTTAAHVMKSRLNQYRTSNVILNFDENGTEATIIGKESKNKRNKKKNSVADI